MKGSNGLCRREGRGTNGRATREYSPTCPNMRHLQTLRSIGGIWGFHHQPLSSTRTSNSLLREVKFGQFPPIKKRCLSSPVGNHSFSVQCLGKDRLGQWGRKKLFRLGTVPQCCAPCPPWLSLLCFSASDFATPAAPFPVEIQQIEAVTGSTCSIVLCKTWSRCSGRFIRLIRRRRNRRCTCQSVWDLSGALDGLIR